MDQAIELTQSQIEDMRIAASKMYGACRRSFQAQMCLKYVNGRARKAERIWGWGRDNVQLGLEEERTHYLFGSTINVEWSEKMGTKISRNGNCTQRNSRRPLSTGIEFQNINCL